MDNQHKHIKGYRDLSQDEIDLMNELKRQEADMMSALDIMSANTAQNGMNPRSLAIAKTHLQTGYMWLIRAIARPNGE